MGQERAEAYLKERVRLHQAAFSKEIPPQCSPEERWATPTTYAIVRPGRKTAGKVFQNQADAQAWQQQYPTDNIEVKPGEDKRCLNYCPYVATNLTLPALAESAALADPDPTHLHPG